MVTLKDQKTVAHGGKVPSTLEMVVGFEQHLLVKH